MKEDQKQINSEISLETPMKPGRNIPVPYAMLSVGVQHGRNLHITSHFMSLSNKSSKSEFSFVIPLVSRCIISVNYASSSFDTLTPISNNSQYSNLCIKSLQAPPRKAK